MDPFFILISSIVGTIVISACCSLTEAALYAVPLAHVRHLSEAGSRSAKILLKQKKQMWRPISAILILNTLANTGGATLAGWAAAQIYHQRGTAIISIVLVFAILYFSEIIPKTIGVAYCRPIALFAARPVQLVSRVLAPLIALSRFLASRFGNSDSQPLVSQEEVLTMAAIGTEEGALDNLEGSVIANVIGLDRLLVRDILTPRVVVFRLEENTTIGSIQADLASWNFSRVPLYSEEDPDVLRSYVTQRDIYREALQGNTDIQLRELSRPLDTVPELVRADKLLLQMFEKKEHICAVVDEHGSLAGIITLEDIIEEIVGKEIVDEYDTVSDLRTFARIMRAIRIKRRRSSTAKSDDA